MSNTTLMRRLLRALAIAVTAASAAMLLLPSGTAAADATKVGVLQQAWFWQTAYEQANAPVAQPAPATEPSGVPDGDLAVAYSGSSDKRSSKMSLLSFDVSKLTPGTSVTAFAFSLKLDNSSSATSFNTVDAALVACLPTRIWPARLGGDYTDEPGVDCAKKVSPEVNGDTYTFKIPTIAQTWADDQNLGVALVADPDTAAAPFQLVFAGAKDVKADLSYTPALSSSGSAGSSSTVSGTVPASGPTGSGSVPIPPASGGSAAVVPAAAAPVVAASPAAAPNTRPVAAAKTAPAVPTKAFWAAALVLAAIVLAASLVLGDPAPVAASATAPSRLDRVLRARTTLSTTET